MGAVGSFKMTKTLSLISTFIVGTFAAKTLVNIKNTKSANICCNARNVQTCQDAVVDPAALLLHTDLDIGGVTLSFVSNVQPHGHVYQNEAGDEAIITFNTATGNMFGSLKTHDG